MTRTAIPLPALAEQIVRRVREHGPDCASCVAGVASDIDAALDSAVAERDREWASGQCRHHANGNPVCPTCRMGPWVEDVEEKARKDALNEAADVADRCRNEFNLDGHHCGCMTKAIENVAAAIRKLGE